METPDEIIRKAQLVPALKPLLPDMLSEKGVSKQEMISRISEIIGKDPKSEEVDVQKLNLIASLRAVGYIVSGGRNRVLGENYRILGWEAPKVKPAFQEWGTKANEKIEKIHSLGIPITSEVAESWVRKSLRDRQVPARHEMSWLYHRCYETGGKAQGFLWDTGSFKAIIVQKDIHRPSFRICPMTEDSRSLLELAEWLGEISITSVKIMNASSGDLSFFRERFPSLYYERGRQAVYNTKDIAENPSKYLNSRAMTTLRRNRRDMRFQTFTKSHFSPKDLEDARQVVSTWRLFNEPKQRQLAIVRDYLAIDAPSDTKLLLLGYRESTPASLHILDRLVHRTNYTAQIVEKSLNYSNMDGGGPGTADINLVATCETLASMGIEWLNAGAYNGGTPGLISHKKRFSFSQETDEYTTTLFTPFKRQGI